MEFDGEDITIVGTMSASKYIGDGSGLTNLPGGSTPSNVNSTKFIQNSFTTATTWSPVAIGNVAGGGGTLTANRLYISPFILEDDISVTKLNFEVTTFGLLSSVYCGVYELDADYKPTGAPVISSTAIGATSNGLKTYTLAATYTLLKDKWYGLAMLSDVNVSHRSFAQYPYYGYLITSAVSYVCMYKDITPGFTSLPTTPVMTGLRWECQGVMFTR